MSSSFKKWISKVVVIVLLGFCTIATYFPFYFMIISSFKNNVEISANPFLITYPFRVDNYIAAFLKVIGYMKNSLFVTGFTVIGTVFVGVLASYVFARFEFPFKNTIYTFILSFLMIPSILTLIPMFVLVNKLHLMGTFWAAILPDMANAQIMLILVLRAFIEGLPGDLFDAAVLDGASHKQVFQYVVFPLTKPTVFSLALITFLNSWNDFLWPLLTLSSSDKLKTITLGLYSFRDLQQIQYGPMFAGFILASIPLIILFSCNMKHFIAGMTAGAVKA